MATAVSAQWREQMGMAEMFTGGINKTGSPEDRQTWVPNLKDLEQKRKCETPLIKLKDLILPMTVH